LAGKSGLIPEGPIILRTSGSSGKIELHAWPTSFPQEQLPPSFENSNDFLNNLIKKSLPIGELVYIKLENADLREDAIKDTYKIFRKRNVDYAFVDFGMFSDASWEFVKRNRLKAPSLNRGAVGKASFFSDDDFDKLIWPGKEDYHYYCKERFNQYYSIPTTISLDLSPPCNKKCDKCQFHSPRSPFKHLVSNNQFMDVTLARKIITEASQWNPKPILVPTFSGEPLLYPAFEEVLNHANKLGFRISITTNGDLLTEDKSRYLLDLGIEALVVSIDAYKEETYEVLQAPGGLTKVKENLLRFLEMRGEGQRPVVGVHFLMEKRNQNEFDKFLNYWAGKIDFVSRAIHQDQFSDSRCTLPLWIPLRKRQACWSAWTCLYIRWNGDVSFCGFDIGSDSSGLNVADKTLSEIWNSEDFWRWRDAQLETDFSVLYCKACPDWAGNRTVTINDDRWKIQRTPLSETYYLKKSK
jgi:MoaA/NifB/PqqE/SkfB family radical SAM enzyme